MKLADIIANTDHLWQTNVNPDVPDFNWSKLTASIEPYDLTDMVMKIVEVESIRDELGNYVKKVVSSLRLGIYDSKPTPAFLLPHAMDKLASGGLEHCPLMAHYFECNLIGVRLISCLQDEVNGIQRGIEFIVSRDTPSSTEDLYRWWHEFFDCDVTTVYAAFHPSRGKNSKQVVVDGVPVGTLWSGTEIDKNRKLKDGQPIFFQETHLEGTVDMRDDVCTLLLHYRTGSKR